MNQTLSGLSHLAGSSLPHTVAEEEQNTEKGSCLRVHCVKAGAVSVLALPARVTPLG